MSSRLHKFVEVRESEWIALRQDLHQYPEVGFTEFRTASIVAERLQQLGYDVRVGAEVMNRRYAVGLPSSEKIEAERRRALRDGAVKHWIDQMEGGLTGVVGEICRGDGPTIAFRFDIDALPLQEETCAGHHNPVRQGFVSRYPGVMHACGHDGHTAIGLALAEWLVQDAADWIGTIRLVFQPAEEGGRGALPMVEAGVVDDVDYFFAAHLGCELPTGVIAAAADSVLASTKWDVHFVGKAAHAAGDPHNGRNALLAGASAALSLHAISRHPGGQTYVNVGTLTAGWARNVVPNVCEMAIELRSDENRIMDFLEERARQVIVGAAAMYEVDVSITSAGSTVAADSDTVCRNMVAAAAATLASIARVLPSSPLGGGDDAAYFMRRVQENGKYAGYFLIGSTLTASHHAPNFDFDERAIAVGVQMFAELARIASGHAAERLM